MIPVINGYIEFEDVTWAMLQTSGFSFKDISDVKVGVQKGVQVTSGTKMYDYSLLPNLGSATGK